MITQVLAIRGATTVDNNSIEEIRYKSIELITEIYSKNNINDKHFDIISVIISTTEDITAMYPAKAIRECGNADIPLFSCLEPPIDNNLKLCIRMLVNVSVNKPNFVDVKHIYLHGARVLRPDLVEE